MKTPSLNQNGSALLETIPLLVIFVMLLSFGMGLFGVVHTAILHSIGSRTYAFETFRQRTNLTYFREDQSGIFGNKVSYQKKGWRYHAVNHETDPRQNFVATTRPITIGQTPSNSTNEDINNSSIYAMPVRNSDIQVNPAWIMVGYGICLNMQCGN